MEGYESGRRKLQDAWEAAPYTSTSRVGQYRSGVITGDSRQGMMARVSANPWAAVGVATLAGFALGFVTGGGDDDWRDYSHPRWGGQEGQDAPVHRQARYIEQQAQAYGAAAPQHESSWTSTLGSVFSDEDMAEFQEQWTTVKSALSTSLVDLLRSTLRESFPSVYREYERVRPEAARGQQGSEGRYQVSTAQPAGSMLNADAVPPAAAV
jgi:hypothetical protein